MTRRFRREGNEDERPSAFLLASRTPNAARGMRGTPHFLGRFGWFPLIAIAFVGLSAPTAADAVEVVPLGGVFVDAAKDVDAEFLAEISIPVSWALSEGLEFAVWPSVVFDGSDLCAFGSFGMNLGVPPLGRQVSFDLFAGIGAGIASVYGVTAPAAIVQAGMLASIGRFRLRFSLDALVLDKGSYDIDTGLSVLAGVAFGGPG